MNGRPTIDSAKTVSRRRFLRHFGIGAIGLAGGVDILTIANQQVFEADIVRRTIDIVVGHVASGHIGEERIDEAYRRIRELKGS